MLLFKLIVVLCACWIANCDLLDLYVQHMDETMKTMAYKNKPHPRDPISRIRRSLEAESMLRIGNFKKQHLNVDDDWLKFWKTRKRIPYKNDDLNIPNKREANLDLDQHEVIVISNTTTTADSRKHSEKLISDIVRYDLESNIPRDLIMNGQRVTLVKKKLPVTKNRERTNGEDSAYLVESQNRVSFIGHLNDDNVESSANQKNSQVEIISENSKTFNEPSLPKYIPRSWSRVPKKYYLRPYATSFKQNVRRAKNHIESETMLSVPHLTRSKRGTKRQVKFTRYEKLDENGDVVLEWDPSDDVEITFKVTAKTLGYIGIGFNEKSNMRGADLLLAWVDDHTASVNLLDSHGIEEMNAAPITDTFQDVRVLGGKQNETHTSVTFVRKWETCDPQDHQLTGDTIRVLWALHPADPELNTAVWHGDKRGGRALRLRTAAGHSPPREIQNVRHWDVKLNQFVVSDNMDTVYWCKIFKAPPLKEKYHMIGYEPLVDKANEDLVHHVILYECTSTSPILGQHARIAGAACYSPTMPRAWESCLQPVLAWARGSKGEWMPEHVGIPIAEHREGSYYMLEVHYNNPGMKKVIDSSGVRLHLTPKLRPYEAGILVAGVAVSPLHLVPPRQREYATAGYCTPHCTNTMFPEEGINVVSVVLHSHLAGRRLSLKHIRQGKELPRIVQDNHFDFDYQQSHTLAKEVKVLPGDELVAECVYGTLNRSKPTLGGYAASQEMCLAFVVHYPRTPLAACYSMTPVKDLFKTLGVHSFKGVTMDHLEKLFLTTGIDSLALPTTNQQQLSPYPAARSAEIDEVLIKEAESALKAMRDYTEERENDNVFSRLIIEDPAEFRGRTMAEHMLELPWDEELLARSIEKSLYHGRHMTFCRKRDDKLALPADIQMFPNYTALPETNDTRCSKLKITSSSTVISRTSVINLVTIVFVLFIRF